MRLFRFSMHYDYHQRGALVVMAEDEKIAVDRVKELVLLSEGKDDWDEVTYQGVAIDVRKLHSLELIPSEVDSGIYIDNGCDC